MGQADDAIAYARAQIGKPYKWATKGPDTFDCSGLIVAAYAAAHPPLSLPHWTGSLIAMGKEVARSELAPGDLVFPDPGHVQLYIGNGQMIEAQQDGVPVRMGPLWGFWRARRIVGGDSIGSIAATALGVLGQLPGPLSAGADVAAVLRPFGVAGLNLVSPTFWRRIGMGGIGVSLIIVGLVYLNRRPIMSVGAGLVNAVGSVGGTAIQGATFGFGAAKGGGGGMGAPVSQAMTKAATRTPRAPAAATGQVTAIPVTAPLPEFEAPRPVKAVGRAAAKPRPLPGEGTTPKPRRRTTPKIPGDVAPTIGKPRKKGLTT